MRRVSAEGLQAGMVLARPIRGPDGQVLVTAGARVGPGLSVRLARVGIDTVYVEDPRFAGLDLEDEVPAACRRLALDLWADLPAPADLPGRIRPLMKLLEAATPPGQPVGLLRPGGEGQYLAIQAINGARLCLAAAPYVGQAPYAPDLALSALLRDIGMAKVPQEWRERPGPLSVEETGKVQAHVDAGVAVLEDPYWSPFVRLGVRQHHERLDGSGYPHQLSGDDLHPGGALVGAVDMLCALMCDRPYRPKLPPEEALDTLLGMADWLFPMRVVTAIARCLALYPLGTVVQLDSGAQAVVVHPGRGTQERPRVRLLDGGHEVDLGAPEHLRVRIAAVTEQ